MPVSPRALARTCIAVLAATSSIVVTQSITAGQPSWGAPAPHPVAATEQRMPLTAVAAAAPLAVATPEAAPSADANRSTGGSYGTPKPRGIPAANADPAARAARSVVSTGELTLPAEATVVGASWERGGLDADDVVQVRTREAGRWGGWQVMPREDAAPDPGTPEAAHARQQATEPFVVTGERAQVRVLSARGGVPAASAVVVDPGSSPADATVGRSAPGAAHADAARPTIYSRADWGADESIRSGAPSYGQAQMAFIHHTAGANGYSAESVPSILRGIYAYHVKTNGWSDIGYNVLVDRFGRAWEGRAGGLDKAVIGAQTLNHNSWSFGVSAIGDYTSLAPSSATLDAIERVVAWKLSIHGMPATGTVSVNGHTYQRITGHRDAYGNSTSCPGQAMYNRIPQIRADVAARMGTMRPVNGARSWDRDLHTDLLGSRTTRSVALSTGASPQPVLAGRAVGSGWGVLDDIVLTQDVTGDGHADIIARNPSANGLLVYRGTGRGGFLDRTARGSGWNVMTQLIAAGDRTGDRRPDLLAVRTDGALVLYPGDGRGWFEAGRVVGTGFTAYRSLTVTGDLTGDGRADLVGLRTSDDALVRWATSADGGVTAPVVQSTGWGSVGAVIGTGDLDRDGATADLLAAERTGRMRTYYAEGSRPLKRITFWGSGWGALDNVSSGADWDGDGRVDVVSRVRATGALVLYSGTGERDFNGGATTAAVGVDADLVRLVGDVTGDGRGDAVARDRGGVLYGLAGTASGFAAPVRLGTGWEAFSQIEPADDYTRDGVPDLLALTPGGTLRLYSFGRDWSWRWVTTLRTGLDSLRSVTGAGSIDADFNGDILTLRDGVITLWRGTGAGTLIDSRTLLSGQSDLVRISGAGDVDGDGENDVVGRDTAGRLWLYPGTASGLSGARQPLALTDSARDQG